MGNCQAAEAATVVIQHPGGRVERLYWATSVSEVMKNNPGHHVALVTLYVSESKPGGGAVRFTRVRLLKPNDTLLLGQVYRLITSQEVTKALRARKLEKLRENLADGVHVLLEGVNTKKELAAYGFGELSIGLGAWDTLRLATAMLAVQWKSSKEAL